MIELFKSDRAHATRQGSEWGSKQRCFFILTKRYFIDRKLSGKLSSFKKLKRFFKQRESLNKGKQIIMQNWERMIARQKEMKQERERMIM